MSGTETSTRTVDDAEIAKFSAMAEEWWDQDGPFKPLHRMNPCRIGYIKSQICAEFGREERVVRGFEGLRLLDIGCGGGLLSEPMARMGADVVGADAAAENIEIAKLHAAQSGLDIDYRATSAEALAQGGETFDAVLALEIIEHVADPPGFVATLARMVRPGGLLILSTLNRTPKSYAVAIVGAEYVLRWLPKGTHDWQRFVRPDEMDAMLTDAGMSPIDRRGMRMDPLKGRWEIGRDLSVNYIASAVRPA